jgi:hypothetical protein
VPQPFDPIAKGLGGPGQRAASWGPATKDRCPGQLGCFAEFRTIQARPKDLWVLPGQPEVAVIWLYRSVKAGDLTSR